MKELPSKIRSRMATFFGLAVAICTGVVTIDFKTFDFWLEWPKLLCIIFIAAGGYLSKIKNISE